MRNSFIQWLCAKAEIDQRIVLLTADLGYSVVEPFSTKYPDRFINVGVAEQNMVGIAAGLATEGYRPYTYSIGVFPTFRCAEQLRNDVDYHQLPVVYCTVGSGVAYGNLGYSHHAIQDLSLIRSLPYSVLGTPSQPTEVAPILDWQYNSGIPTYLRMHKAGEKSFNTPSSKDDLELPWCLTNKEEAEMSSVCILVSSHLASMAMDVQNKIGTKIPLYSVPLWGQRLRNKQTQWLAKFKHIIALEDHILDGGFGSYIAESLMQSKFNSKLDFICFPSSSVGLVAKEDTLLNSLRNQLASVLLQYT